MIRLKKELLAVGVTLLVTGCAAISPAPVSNIGSNYSNTSRGSYRGSFYKVKKGDTLYFIAYITDKDVNEIIHYNNLTRPYTIYPGQKLKLWHPAYIAPEFGQQVAIAKTPTITTTSPKLSNKKKVVPSTKSSKNSKTSRHSPATKVVKQVPVKGVEQSKSKEYVEAKGNTNVNSSPPSYNAKISKWLWPTRGRVISNFSVGDQGNKGIDIAGQRGQAIISTAAGTVVYSGNALRGYGNLIIIKHNDDYLSAYAHNERLLVSEGQNVKAGQKIATMGSSGTKSVRLHFEIRYQGKSVNPKRYLP